MEFSFFDFNRLLTNLVVFPERMLQNMQVTHGLIYSQRVLLKLVESGLSREQAYDLVQAKTALAWDQGQDFKQLLAADPKVMSQISSADLDDAFDYHWHLRRVDLIFKRLGLK